MKNRSFWKNKNVLITGAAGFVGSNLSKNLSKNGAKRCWFDTK
jgi:nucleoside-diphosphate-sugar epimerase